MTTIIFISVLFAAALHALWNAVIKSAIDKTFMTAGVVVFSAFISLLLIPFFPLPHIQSWIYLICSAMLQIGYFILIAKIYHIADMGQTYPLMRGIAPIIVAISAVFLLDERLAINTWIAIMIISLGTLFMLSYPQNVNKKALLLVLLNAFVIAGYTLIDGIGVRKSGSAIAYSLWLFFITGLIVSIWFFYTQNRRCYLYLKLNWRYALIGGAGTTVSYGLALWAMNYAAIAVVAALRESSIVFALFISIFKLKENISKKHIIASCMITFGVVLLRYSF